MKSRAGAFSCRVIDRDAGLDVVTKGAELYQGIFYGSGLHQDAGGEKIGLCEDRCHTVEDVISGSGNIGKDRVFIGKHALHIQVPGPCDQVFFIGILSRELKSDQMAAIVQIISVNAVIFYGMPAGRFYRADTAPLCLRQRLRPHERTCARAASQFIQLTINLQISRRQIRQVFHHPDSGLHLCLIKKRHISVDVRPDRSRIWRNF